MRLRPTFQIAPVELVQSLRRDDAILFGSEPGGDLLPCPALLALLTDELHERFKSGCGMVVRPRYEFVSPAG